MTPTSRALATAVPVAQAGFGWANARDPFIAAAWAIGLVALTITVGLALQVLAMRARSVRRERRRDAVLAAWRPVLFERVLGGAPPLPAVSRRDEDTVLLLWTQLQDGLRGDARERLNAVGAEIDAHAMARRRLARDAALDRLLGLRTLGYLGCVADYPDVALHLDDARPYLCLAAARALVHIDPARAPGDVLPRLAARGDWPVPLFATVLGEADAREVASRFRALHATVTSEQRVRLLPLLSVLDAAIGDEILRELLANADAPDVLGAALRCVRSAGLLGDVRRLCAHPAWAVRTQAAAALGRVGGPAERDVLLGLLTDSQWWVRYRAAKALASGRFGGREEVTALASGLGDRFARDIVEHALAEDAA
ncbi:MAG TPA: HEAT repeat domain-containing protein [Anaeromyxobacter sp.]|jgi:hypothetical protein|nr:HEAT repeat domain-containing protein [Anaeromyxobacter sp.]